MTKTRRSSRVLALLLTLLLALQCVPVVPAWAAGTAEEAAVLSHEENGGAGQQAPAAALLPVDEQPAVDAPFTAKIGDRELTVTEVDSGIYTSRCQVQHSYKISVPEKLKAEPVTITGLDGYNYREVKSEQSCWGGLTKVWPGNVAVNDFGYHLHDLRDQYAADYKDLHIVFEIIPDAQPEQPAVDAPFTAKIGDQILKIVDGGEVDCMEWGSPAKKQAYCVMIPADTQATQFTYNGMGGQLAVNNCEEYGGWLYDEQDKQLDILDNDGYYHIENGSEIFHITFRRVSDAGEKITVSLSAEARTAGKGDLVPMTELSVMEKGTTIKDVLDTLAAKNQLSVKYTEQGAIQSIGELGTNAEGGGWRCYLNGKAISESVQTQTVQAGDEIRIRYAVSATGDELDKPLYQYLQIRTEQAKEKLLGDYTQSSKRALQAAIDEAEAILADVQNNSTQADKELLVSDGIAKLNLAESKLTVSDGSVEDPAIPDDFENDLWLQYDFKEMKIGDTAKIYPRRVPQIIDDPISNRIERPNFHFDVVRGNSVALSGNQSRESVSVTAVQDGVTIVKVTYDAYKNYGASSPVNTAYVVFQVNSDPADLSINTSLSAIRSYDTIYYAEGDTVPYTFTVDVPGAEKVEVTCNDQVLTANGDGTYTANLESRSNVLGIEAVGADGKIKSYYHVVDARKIQITVQNLTNPGQPIKINDRAKVSFRGITMPVYKLATIYNPCYTSSWGDEAAYVHYQNEKLGEFKGQCKQWDLATNNSFEILFTEAGDYTFTGGNIQCYWWGDSLGADKEKEGSGDPNTNADTQHDSFSMLPDFTIKVASEISNHVPVSGITMNKTELTLKEGESFQLTANVLPQDASNQNFKWKLSNGTGYFITMDETGKITAHHANHEHVPFVTVYAITEEGDFAASCKVTVVKAEETVPETPVLSGGSLTVAAPVAGNMPAQATTEDTGYKIVGTTWNPDHKTFAANTAYSVEIVLEAKDGIFAKDAAFTINGKAAQVKENTGSRVTITLDFDSMGKPVAPQTGDSSQMTLWFAAGAISLLGAAALIRMNPARRKQNRDAK